MAEKIFNDLTKGMLRKINPLKKDQNFYNFGLNLSTDKNRIDRLTKVCESKLEDYFKLKDVDYIILGVLYLNIEEYIFFITDKLGSFSEILYYKDGDIEVKYNNPLLNFNPSNIVLSTYRVNYNTDRIVYFVDGLNVDRVINIDKIQLSDNIESLAINPIYGYSDYLEYNINTAGGNLRSGKYSIFISYNDINGKESSFKDYVENIPLGNGIYHKTSDTTGNLVQYDRAGNFDVYGLPANSPTGKSIDIYPNVNDNYETLNIYVVLETDAEITVYLLENLPMDNKVTIGTLDNYLNLGSDVSQILVNNIIYNYSEAITQKDNRLLLANTKPEGYDANFQEIANNITVEAVVNRNFFGTTNAYGYDNKSYISQGVSLGSHQANNTDLDKQVPSDSNYLSYTQSIEVPSMSFMRDDVYALGVYFELENGVFTDVYHIPGRLPNSIPSDFYGGSSEITTYDSAHASNWDFQIDGGDQVWKSRNTSVKHATEDRLALGYHRTDSVYPDGYGFPTNGEANSQGRSYIRHHRIPSDVLVPIIEDTNIGGTVPFYKRERLFVNLKFNNIVIPSELEDKIKNTYFCIANRDEYNKKVIDKGIIYATRDTDIGIRNSELLNNPVLTGDRNTRYYEFMSPNVDFKFKQFNIKADKVKMSGVLTGKVGYMTKRYNDSFYLATPENVKIQSYINSEGINPSTTDRENIIFDYKQEITLSRCNYNLFSRKPFLHQLELDDIIFADNNSSVDLGDTIILEGSQNTSVLKISGSPSASSTDLLPGDGRNNLVSSDYKFRAGTSEPGNLRDKFYYIGSNVNNTWDVEDRRFRETSYFDSTDYVTLLTDNNDIFTNLLQLTYSRIVGNGDFYQGDCYIENHYTKKGYSTLVSDSTYQTLLSDWRRKDTFLNRINFGTFEIVYDTTDNIDMSVSESYITYPVETRLNIRMRRQDGDNTHYPYNIFLSNNPYNELEKKALTQQNYTLDEPFSKSRSINTLFSNNVKVSDLDNLNKKVGNRIVYSELQNNESRVDSFRKFLPNNYRDIITNKGDIHKLFIKDNNLYVITRDSIFVLNSSNNFLTTRGGPDIYVGTGEFLGTTPEELISLETGFAGTISKLSFNESKFGYLFVDSIRNKIILFDKGLNDLNILGLEEDLSINLFKQFPELNDGTDKPLLGYGILSGFDPETDRLFITKLDYVATELLLNSNYTINNGLFYVDDELIDFSNKDYFENKSFTVTYDAINNIWISYHDYFPRYYIPHPSKLLLKLEDVYSKMYGDNYTDNFIIDISFNENQATTKVFDSIQFDLTSESSEGEFTENFFSSLVAYTSSQSTGLINLNSIYPYNNITRKETYWNFSKLLDISSDKLNKKLFLSDWNSIKDNYFIDKVINNSDIDPTKDYYKKKRFRGKLINVRLFKDNIENNKFTINFAVLNYRPSFR